MNSMIIIYTNNTINSCIFLKDACEILFIIIVIIIVLHGQPAFFYFIFIVPIQRKSSILLLLCLDNILTGFQWAFS